MRPLLAHLYEPKRVSYPCFVQPKLNGVRALYQNGNFQSRDEVPFPPLLLDHLAKPLQEIFKSDIILDGELYVHGWPLQRINAAVTPVRQEPTEDTLKVEYHVFDRVDYGQGFYKRIVDVCVLCQSTPFSTMVGHVPVIPQVHVVPTYEIKNVEQGDAWYVKFVDYGYEGMMYRIDDCPYTLPKQRKPPSQKVFLSDKNNRSWSLLKRKSWQDAEFICVGLVEGEGKYRGMLGALICQAPIPDILGNRFGKTESIRHSYQFTVSSGLSDQQRRDIWENPSLAIGHQIKVRFLCLSSDGLPLNPSIELIL